MENLKKEEDNKELLTEFGSVGNVGFVNGTLYDSEDKEMKCSCGKRANQVFISEHSYLGLCTECMERKLEEK